MMLDESDLPEVEHGLNNDSRVPTAEDLKNWNPSNGGLGAEGNKPKGKSRKRKGKKDTSGTNASGKPTADNLDPSEAALGYLEAGKVAGYFTTKFHNGGFLTWAGGGWIDTPTPDVRANLIRHVSEDYSHLPSRIVSDVLDHLKAQCLLSSRVKPPTWLGDEITDWKAHEVLSVKNGLIHLPTVATGGNNYLRPHTPAFFSPLALDYSFTPTAGKPLRWLRFLAELWPDDEQSIHTLQEMFGYMLTADTSQQKIFLIVGPPRSGKGTIARVLTALVGEWNVCGPTLGSLATHFGLSTLIGKNVAIISDARIGSRTDSAVIVERLLAISGEDAISIPRKYMTDATMRLPTKFVLLTNELPKLAESSGALSKRMILFRLKQNFYGRENHELTEQLLHERSAILLWAIEGWKRLRDRKRFVQPESSARVIQQLEDLASPVAAFVRDCCTVAPEANIAKSDLYEKYEQWAKEQGRFRPDDAATFGRNLFAAFPEIDDTQRRFGASRVWYYEGICLQ